MPKYIELEEAIDLFYSIDPENDGSDGCTAVLISNNYTSEEIEGMLSLLPAADVAPVVHAKWIENENFDIGFWTCSNCSFVSEAIAAPKLYNYCPNCSAKMDLEG